MRNAIVLGRGPTLGACLLGLTVRTLGSFERGYRGNRLAQNFVQRTLTIAGRVNFGAIESGNLYRAHDTPRHCFVQGAGQFWPVNLDASEFAVCANAELAEAKIANGAFSAFDPAQ